MLILLNITFPSFSISLSRDRIPSLKHLSLSIYSGCASLFPRCWTCVARFTSKDGALPTHLFLFWRSYALHREGNKEWLTFDERRKLSYSAVKNREIMIKEYIAEKETERSIPDRAALAAKSWRGRRTSCRGHRKSRRNSCPYKSGWYWGWWGPSPLLSFASKNTCFQCNWTYWKNRPC